MAETRHTNPLVDELESAGISRKYAHNIVRGHRVPSDSTAIRIWRKTGRKIGRIADVADADLIVMERVLLHGRAA